MLLVGTFLSQRLASPFSSIRVRMYFPSGEIATSDEVPESVTLMIEKFWNKVDAGRATKLRIRSASRAATASATRSKIPHLRLLAGATALEEAAAGCAASTAIFGVPAGITSPELARGTLRPDSMSRFRRFRSPRRSAAD